MIRIRFSRLMLGLLLFLLLVSLTYAFAATNSVPVTRLTNQAMAITANALKPAECSALALSAVVVCTGGNCDGSGVNELLLGSSAGERIRGRGGTDCLLGGGGDDQLVGNGGTDVCIGGPGNDTFQSCAVEYQ